LLTKVSVAIFIIAVAIFAAAPNIGEAARQMIDPTG
jgi:hypothetical protein